MTETGTTGDEDRQSPVEESGAGTRGEREVRARHIAVTFWAVTLAAGGIGLALLGQRLGKPVLEGTVGPGLTLCGAGLWLFGRLRERARRE